MSPKRALAKTVTGSVVVVIDEGGLFLWHILLIFRYLIVSGP